MNIVKNKISLACERTRDFEADIDHKQYVCEKIYNAARADKSHATTVASVLSTQTSNVAS